MQVKFQIYLEISKENSLGVRIVQTRGPRRWDEPVGNHLNVVRGLTKTFFRNPTQEKIIRCSPDYE